MSSNKKFSFSELNNLFNNGPLKDHQDAKNYISGYFFPLINGTHALIENNDLTIIQDETLRKVYLARFPKQIKKFYLEETIPKNIICDVKQPIITEQSINVCKRFKHEYQEYNTFDKKTKSSVELFLTYIYEVWADSNDDSFNYIINWLANMTQGNKNISCIYAKSTFEGTGKSTLPEFLSEFILGYQLTCKGKSDHLKGQHNSSLMGRLFVYFEELQIFSKSEWLAVDTEMKDIITSKWGSYTDKYEKRIETDNINNIMITTNHNFKGVNGRRYFVIDISTKYTNDTAYYGNLRKKCFNDLVGKAFFSYLLEIDVSNFNSAIMPETKNKRDLIIEYLSPIEKFLKVEFVLQNKSVDDKVINLCAAFKGFYTSNPSINNDKFNSVSFNRLMREIGFDSYKTGGYYKYKISIETLKKMSVDRKWIHDFDTIENNEEIEKSNDIKTCLNGDGVVLTNNEYEEYSSLLAEKKARDKKGGIMITIDEYEEFKAYKEKVVESKPKLTLMNINKNKKSKVKKNIKEVVKEDEEEDEEEDDIMKEEDEKKPIKKIKDLKDSEIDDLEFNF